MTLHDVALLFRKTQRTIWNWTNKKKLLEPVRIGGSVYYRRTDVEKLMGIFKDVQA